MQHENPTVGALNRLSIAQPHHGAAYREFSGPSRDVLGDDIETRAVASVREWCRKTRDGVLVLTGNAGTSKSALAQVFCKEHGVETPADDGLHRLDGGRVILCKDLSALGDGQRTGVRLAMAEIAGGGDGVMLLCGNEGVLRPLVHGDQLLESVVLDALRHLAGISGDERVFVLNMNRQRWTTEAMWDRLVDYAAREPLWDACSGCPAVDSCPIRLNAEKLRAPAVREAMRELIRIACADEVTPLRDMLTVIAYTITGHLTCQTVLERYAERGASGFSIADAYFAHLFGSGLLPEVLGALPIMRALAESGVGSEADLQVDTWLREGPSNETPEEVRIALGAEGSPSAHECAFVGTERKTLSDIGQVITVRARRQEVDEALRTLLDRDGNPGLLTLWRRKAFFEAHATMGGPRKALDRLSIWSGAEALLDAIDELGRGKAPFGLKKLLIRGVNQLGSGMPDTAGELFVPDPGITAAREIGSFLPPPPLMVQGKVSARNIDIRQRRFPEEHLLDTDELDLVLGVRIDGEPLLEHPISPRLFEALYEAASYQTPPGPDAPEMAELELLLSDLSRRLPASHEIRIAVDGAERGFVPPDLSEPAK